VICEIMKDDGTMARLPDLQLFAAEHGLKIGTIADLIEHRSRTESLITKVGSRPLQTAYGQFTARTFRDTTGHGVHLALVKGEWDADTVVPVRVHEPLSVLDALEINRSMHSWSLDTALAYLKQQGHGVVVLLNCGESGEQLLAQFDGTARAAQAPERGRMDLRHWRANSIAVWRTQDAADGQPAPHAQHDGLRPRDYWLYRQINDCGDSPSRCPLDTPQGLRLCLAQTKAPPLKTV
jgi:GTP cyclohydrolase II